MGVISIRILKFIVDGQIIKQNPNCDFTGLVPGTDGYLAAEFSFSPEWNGAIKVAEFWRGVKECPPQLLEDGETCMIPAEALKGKKFALRIIGKSKDAPRIATGKIKVRQDGGRPWH